MLDVYSSLGSAQDSKCASSAILGKDFLSNSPPAYLGQAPTSREKKFPTALVVGGLIVGGVVLYYASRVGGTLAANPAKRTKKKIPSREAWMKVLDVSSTEKVPLDTLASGLLSLTPVENVAPLIKSKSVVFVVESDYDQMMTERLALALLDNALRLDGSVSYMGLVKSADGIGPKGDRVWEPGRPIVIKNGQKLSAQAIRGLGEIRNQVCVIGATSSDEWGVPSDSLGRLNVLLEAARATKAVVLVAVGRLWYSAKPKTLHDNPRNNDSYSPFPVEQIPGGRASGMRPSDFDPVELARGAEHELEHTDDWRVAREIAQDHLIEDENYYQKLDAMERGAFRDNPKLQWQGSGSGSWARGPNYTRYRLLQRAPGEWLVYLDDVVVGAERTPALAKRLAQEHAGRRDNPWSEAGCVADCHATFGKNDKPLYLKKCLAACHGVLLGKGLADLPKGA